MIDCEYRAVKPIHKSSAPMTYEPICSKWDVNHKFCYGCEEAVSVNKKTTN